MAPHSSDVYISSHDKDIKNIKSNPVFTMDGYGMYDDIQWLTYKDRKFKKILLAVGQQICL